MGDVIHINRNVAGPEEPPRILLPMEATSFAYGGEVIRAAEQVEANLPPEKSYAELGGRLFTGRIQQYEVDSERIARVYSGTFVSRHSIDGAPTNLPETDFRNKLGGGLIIAVHDKTGDNIEYWRLDRYNRDIVHAHSAKLSEELSWRQANDGFVAVCTAVRQAQLANKADVVDSGARPHRVLGWLGLRQR